MNFKTVLEFVTWLIVNEGETLEDQHGRRWFYENYDFYFKDLNSEEYTKGAECLHLYATVKNPDRKGELIELSLSGMFTDEKESIANLCDNLNRGASHHVRYRQSREGEKGHIIQIDLLNDTGTALIIEKFNRIDGFIVSCVIYKERVM